MNDTLMPFEGAVALINMGHNIAHVRHWAGPYVLVKTKFDPDFNTTCKEIPSWMWIPDERSFKVHYLDLPLFEAIAFKKSYQVRYQPEIIPVLKSLKESYLERKAWKKAAYVDIPAKRPLRQYQTIGAQFMYKTGKVLNADGMGAGKSCQTIGAILLNKIDGKGYRTVILCPATMRGVWRKEISNVTDELRPCVIEGNLEKRMEIYEKAAGYDVLIMSYECFISDYDMLANHFKTDILVIDECHRISNRQNRITQILIGGRTIKKTFIHMAEPHSIYLLTGTPISNKLEDLYSMLRLIDPGIFNWTGFSNRYTVEDEGKCWRHAGGVSRPTTFKKIVGYRNELELKAKLSLHMIRRNKDEILPELPEKVFSTIEVELNAEERKAYNDLKKDFKADIRGKDITVVNTLGWMTRAQQICNSMETLPGSPTKKSSKLDELIKIVEAEAPNRKIVIFSKYSEMTNIICREFKQFKPLHLHGSTKEDREEMIRKFQEEDKYRLFVSTIKAGGVGITLTAADMVILYDRWWNPGGNFQAIDRLHRIGQKNSVLAVTLRVKNSIEENIEKIWMRKQITIDEIVGDEARLTQMTKEELEELL